MIYSESVSTFKYQLLVQQKMQHRCSKHDEGILEDDMRKARKHGINTLQHCSPSTKGEFRYFHRYGNIIPPKMNPSFF